MSTPKNSVSDRPYFVRRLRNAGWATDVLIEKYPVGDKREWSIVVSRNKDNVFITYRRDQTFHIYDGIQFFDGSTQDRQMVHATSSMEVIQTILVDAGINDKHPNYGKRRDGET